MATAAAAATAGIAKWVPGFRVAGLLVLGFPGLQRPKSGTGWLRLSRRALAEAMEAQRAQQREAQVEERGRAQERAGPPAAATAAAAAAAAAATG